MRLPILSLMGASLGLLTSAWAQSTNAKAVTSATLDESEVRITYGELKRLVAATLPKLAPPELKPKPPVPAALLAAIYRFDASAGTLVADMRVEAFEEGWQLVPVAGAVGGATSVEPEGVRLVSREDALCLITDKVGSQELQIAFGVAPIGQATPLYLAPSAVAALEIKAIPEGKVVRFQQGTTNQLIVKAGSCALSAAGGEVTLVVEDARQAPLANTTTEDAIISTATYTTEVARDGSAFTQGVIIAHHEQPVKLTVQMPEGSRLLQCQVNSESVRVVALGTGRLEIPLDDPTTDGAESELKLSFTSTVPPLQIGEGEIELLLPQTPVFVKQVDWSVQLPVGYDLTFSGNVDAVTDKPNTPGLQLRKAFCRDQQPQARITYRKRSST